jgi:hypothetical protein
VVLAKNRVVHGAHSAIILAEDVVTIGTFHGMSITEKFSAVVALN